MQEFTTPMMKQYTAIKKQYQDCLLFFRMGDFYELFLEDAYIGAKVLDIVLTSRAKGKDGRVPMAGVPYHAVDSYISKLVSSGYKVAICEQVSEPDKYGIVDREVIRVVTPGTILDEQSLEKKEHNYIVSLVIRKTIVGLAVADISTGLFQILEFDDKKKEHNLKDELHAINPSECILPQNLYNNPELLKKLKEFKEMNIYCFQESERFIKKSEAILTEQFGKQILLQQNLKQLSTAEQAASVLVGYLKYTQKDKISHFKTISLLTTNRHMVVDYSTMMNLELFSTLRTSEKVGSLIHHIDNTVTAMGGRLLRNLLRRPFINAVDIEKRHESVENLLENRELRNTLEETLKHISDIERKLSRLSVGIGNARDMISIKESLVHILQLKMILKKSKNIFITELLKDISDELKTIIGEIERSVIEEPARTLKDGGMIREGIHEELDRLRTVINDHKSWLATLEKNERVRTGIASLKIRFNKVFGFYIEISKSNLDSVPSDYMRKQTLVNAERFITPGLKEKEEYILSGETRIFQLEYELFTLLREKILQYTDLIQKSAQAVAEIDCILGFARLAENKNYIRPQLITSGDLFIKNGRHPVVENSLGDNQFVPNNTQLDKTENQLIIITGPNMAGKSVYIRQVALIILLNQIGSFIPASEAKLSIVDKLFVRSGASDMISEGLSTFMVEMVETAQILKHATSNSLVIMDEIGRGTSTYDGISIAWAIAQYLVTNKKTKPKTLFATHYHELQDLEKKYKQIKNYHMEVADEKGIPVFLYALRSGGASHSFGIAVAKIAGLPEEVVTIANNILPTLEDKDKDLEKIIPQKIKSNELLTKELQKININSITPLEALQMLEKLQKKLKNENHS
jgi:DNA mismatch repair protein MutS